MAIEVYVGVQVVKGEHDAFERNKGHRAFVQRMGEFPRGALGSPMDFDMAAATVDEDVRYASNFSPRSSASVGAEMISTMSFG